MTGMAMRIASPPGYGPTDVDVERLIAAGAPEAPYVTNRPPEAAKGADAAHPDVWPSMGHEAQAAPRRQRYEGCGVEYEEWTAAAPDRPEAPRVGKWWASTVR